MKKIKLIIVSILILLGVSLTSCGDDTNVIKVCASETPHAEVLNGIVKDLLKEKGYTLKVSVLDWTTQNDAVARKDYDANYFQHIPYLNSYDGNVELVASCKVHYEPLGIYSNTKTTLAEGKYEICNDESNAVRAFQLLVAKNIINKEIEKDNFPYTEDEKLNFTGNKWESLDKKVKVSLVAEELLTQSLPDYDYGLLPCNTAYTGNIDKSKRIAFEDDLKQVSLKANVLAVRKNDYLTDSEYKNKIDALTDVLLSSEVSNYFNTKFLGAITCDATSQIDLRNSIK